MPKNVRSIGIAVVVVALLAFVAYQSQQEDLLQGTAIAYFFLECRSAYPEKAVADQACNPDLYTTGMRENIIACYRDEGSGNDFRRCLNDEGISLPP